MARDVINIVIADDNKFFCEALSDSLSQHDEIEVIKSCVSLNDLINFCSKATFDILVLDLNFKGSNSLDYLDQIRNNASRFSIIALTSLNRNFFKVKALEKGIEYFVGKDSNLLSLKSVIIDCYKNCSQPLLLPNTSKISIDNIVFTKRKLELLQCFYEHADKTEIELSKIINISVNTIKTHKRELFEITNTNNITELIKYGIKNGLILS